MAYNHLEIEKKWQERWEKEKTFKTDTTDFSKPKYYILDMFPYPSGAGLHVGHPRGYTATDIIARMKRMQGFNVLHPMGWDAFGLPAEQYAINTNHHPGDFTYKNIATFKKQIQSLGLSYDWDREIATTDPDYYKWTQWIFTKLYEKGLAYIDEKPVNWCEELGTVLANEEVINGVSERGGYPVVRKPMKQWVLKITDYADRLLQDLDTLDWPSATIEMQKNWIGKSEGVVIIFKIDQSDQTFEVFTTRVDTLFGATYCVLAPEHPLIKKITTPDHINEVHQYVQQCASKSDLERTELNKDKTGVFTGAYAINPVNDKKIPIYIGDYVLASYGTGAVMAVPCHDQRDYEFAKKYHLERIQVIEGDVSTQAYVEDGKHIHSSYADGLNIKDAKEAILQDLIAKKAGYKKVNYKLRDWLFSRQRYWGEPIPIVHMEDGSIYCLKPEELPLKLPNLKEYKPSGSIESPLVHATDWLNVEINGKKGRRETNTMPQWAGSCWYYLRFIDPKNKEMIGDPKLLEHWLPVDLYVGGAEHAVLHLLYARFWHKVLYDLGIVKTKEPFQKLFHQGMILGENNEKMSKSRGNVINPDEIVLQYGADTLRMYEMFMGPLEASLPWSTQGLEGSRRFIDRVYRLFMEKEYQSKMSETNDGALDKVYHQTVKKVTEDFQNLQFNTAIAQMMIFINEAYKAKTIYKEYVLGFIKLMYPVTPHICEEMWEKYQHQQSITYEPWPTYDPTKIIDQKVTIAIQVNGKLRATLITAKDTPVEQLKQLALDKEEIKKYIENKEIKKVIAIVNKIVNIVVVN